MGRVDKPVSTLLTGFFVWLDPSCQHEVDASVRDGVSSNERARITDRGHMYTNNHLPQPGRGRRTYSPEFKAQLVAACRIPGMSVASVARNHGINHNILHRWLRELPDPAALRLP